MQQGRLKIKKKSEKPKKGGKTKGEGSGLQLASPPGLEPVAKRAHTEQRSSRLPPPPPLLPLPESGVKVTSAGKTQRRRGDERGGGGRKKKLECINVLNGRNYSPPPHSFFTPFFSRPAPPQPIGVLLPQRRQRGRPMAVASRLSPTWKETGCFASPPHPPRLRPPRQRSSNSGRGFGCQNGVFPPPTRFCEASPRISSPFPPPF